MNIKALITTLFLGSSSVAMAKPVLTIKGSASVSVGSNVRVRDHRTPRTVVVRDHRHSDDCHDAPAVVRPAPVYPVAHQPYRPGPVWNEPYFQPSNTIVGATASSYTGAIFARPAWRGRAWFNLTEATRIDGGREFFTIEGRGGHFTKLLLKGLGGRTDITMIGIEYGKKPYERMQVVRLDNVLTRSGSSAMIHLDGDSRDINRIIVYGTSGSGSAYQILAM